MLGDNQTIKMAAMQSEPNENVQFSDYFAGLDGPSKLRYRIPCHLFACHWIRIASIVLCFVLQRTPTNENNGGTEWRGIQQFLIETAGFHSFIGLFRFTITFSRCPQIAKASLGGQCLYKTKYALQMVLNWQVNKSQVSTHISFLVLFRQHACHEISCKPAVLYLPVKQMQ